ncbi:hypothetical protein MNBD_PLANCTO03-2044 [hydrothermal vent metagenome]|uniref:Dockerin domain-containing protein n=1 Tax=hydrothermal vent metagenome TaxID=652676 RepID=A0A3B1DA79_9ZZZZ
MHSKITTVLGLTALAASVAHAQTYTFAIDPTLSGLTATMGFDIDTAGTLIGDWNPDTNPAGTRTKPGLWGSFGSTENLPAAVEMGIAILGDLDTQTAGSFAVAIDLELGLITIDSFVADLVAGGPAVLPATLSLSPESFRTRQPESVYIGIPIDIPIGELALTSLTLTQTATAPGTLVEIEEGRYSFAVLGAAEMAGTYELLGTPTDIPPTPTVLAITGEIVLAGETATITSVQLFDQSDVQNPGEPIPEFPMEIPTILPPGEIASLLMNLVLEQVATTFIGDLTLTADGSLLACPADFNADGEVDTRDVLAFLNAWTADAPEADFNADGTIDTRDVLAFLNAWTEGC